jgi:hypothetical protein
MTKQETINFRELTAPCGLDCFNCPHYLAKNNEELRKQLMSRGFTYNEGVCGGCRKENGFCAVNRKYGYEQCKIFKCVSLKGIESCADCSDFPCDNLHPH